MPEQTVHPGLSVTLRTLLLGACGALIGYWVSLPLFLLTGPAILISSLSLTRMRFAIHPLIWNAALLVIGLRIGAGITNEATAAFLRWPLAFVALAGLLGAIMFTSRWTLERVFGFSRIGATLAATPGHLSMVLGLGAELKSDLARISVVQAVRILALTLLVPFAAGLSGLDLGIGVGAAQGVMPVRELLWLAGFGLVLGLTMRRLRIPAPMLIGGMIVSTSAHVGGLSTGALSPWIAMPGFIVVGTMIGTRFSGISVAQLRRDGLAGILITAIAGSLALVASWPVAAILGVPLLHVLVAFAPGGLETMVVIGAVLGANPGFIAACHVARLFMLLFLLPLMLGRNSVRPHSPP